MEKRKRKVADLHDEAGRNRMKRWGVLNKIGVF